MTAFHDLSRRLDDLVVPSPDIDALVAAGEHRLRRRRITAAVASAAAVVVLAAGSALAIGHRTQSTGPIDLPNTPAPTQEQEPQVPVTRRIVYSGGLSDPTIHFGDREIKVRTAYVHLDVTDDGFVYTTPTPFQRADPTVWFSNGGEPERIGRHCGSGASFTPEDVMTGSSGSLVVWFECKEPTSGLSLVVYDTSIGRETLRRPIPGCDERFQCVLTAVVGEHVYLSQRLGERNVWRDDLFDVGTGTLQTVTPRYWWVAQRPQSSAYLADLRSDPRSLVVGGSRESGSVTDGIGLDFAVSGSRLVPQLDSENPPTNAYDSTGRPLRLRVPAGYHRASGVSLVEWLDDDTIALAAYGEGPYSGDVLTCHLADGRCDFVVKGQGSDTGVGSPLFPQQWLPA